MKLSTKTSKWTVFALFCLLFCLVVALSACDGQISNMPFANLGQTPFTAELEGEFDGEKTIIRIFCDPTEHTTKEIYDRITVTFDAPAALQGIVVTLRSDGKGTIRLGEITEEMPLYGNMADRFLKIFPTDEPTAVKRTDSGYEVLWNLENGHVIVVCCEGGQLKKICGEVDGGNFWFNITKFQEIIK